MNFETIQANIAPLPSIELDSVPEDHQIWEADDGEAHVKVTRHTVHIEDEGEEAAMGLVGVSVSGPVTERQRVLGDFMTYFDAAPASFESSEDPNGIDVYVWVAAP